MIVALVVIFFVIFLILAAIANKNGLNLSFKELAGGALSALFIIGFVLLFFVLPIVLMFY